MSDQVVIDLKTSEPKSILHKVLLWGGAILVVLFFTAVIFSLKYDLPIWAGSGDIWKDIVDAFKTLIPSIPEGGLK